MGNRCAEPWQGRCGEGIERCEGDGDPKQPGPASVLRTREITDGGHLVAVPGDCEAACGECAVQDDRSMCRAFHPQVERRARSRRRVRCPSKRSHPCSRSVVARIRDTRLREEPSEPMWPPTSFFSMSLACRCAATVKPGSSPITPHGWRSRLIPLYTAAPNRLRARQNQQRCREPLWKQRRLRRRRRS